jgi:hypothetical protein
VVPILVAIVGCYRYEPVQTPRPGTEVRARFTNEAAVRRSEGLEEAILYLDGRVVEQSPEALTLDVLVARSTSVFQDITIRDTMRVPLSDIQSVMAREISLAKSLLFAGAVGAGAVLVVAGISAISGGSQPGDNGGGPQAIVVPAAPSSRRIPLVLFSIPMRE